MVVGWSDGRTGTKKERKREGKKKLVLKRPSRDQGVWTSGVGARGGHFPSLSPAPVRCEWLFSIPRTARRPGGGVRTPKIETGVCPLSDPERKPTMWDFCVVGLFTRLALIFLGVLLGI